MLGEICVHRATDQKLLLTEKKPRDHKACQLKKL